MRRELAAFAALAVVVCGVTYEASRLPDSRPTTHVEVYEDGSGVQWIDGREVRRFGDGTFVWSCETMGNRECGQ